MATRTAIDLKTLGPADIDYEQDSEGTGKWPSRYLNLSKHIERIAPGVPAYLLDRKAGDPLGWYDAGARRILVFGRPHIYEQATTLHELWHYAEYRLLSESDRSIVYREAAGADEWYNDYLDSHSEQAARAFEHYASARAHGLKLAPAKKGSAQEVFQRIYEGKAHAAHEKRRRWEQRELVTGWVWAGVFVAVMAGVFIVLPHFFF